MRIDINSDMGELEESAVEEALMPHITSANVACGAHAGDLATMARTVALARRFGVAIGAHPGYPDRANFGRREMALAPEEIERSVYEQVRALAAVAAPGYVKPHGALYNVAANNAGVAQAVARGVARWSRDLVLVGLAGSAMLAVWREMGFRVASEGFADRRYEADGSLRSRRFPDALITAPETAAGQAARLAGQVETICIHSDTPQAPAIAAAVRARLVATGFTLQPLAPAPPPPPSAE